MCIKPMSLWMWAEEVVAVIRRQEQDDAAYERRMYRHKAHYSLNREDGIENDAINRPLTRRKSWSRSSCERKCTLR